MKTTGSTLSIELADRAWPDVAEGSTVAVPVGAFEQHGPHLPLDTDTRIADAVARSLPGVSIAPAIGYGASGEHEGFPGTVSIGAPALEAMLVEFGRSACRWAQRVVFVNGHGGNVHALIAAVQLLRYEGRDAAWVPCSVPGADAHAGLTETSVMLHLAPDSVNMARAEKGNTDRLGVLLPRLRTEGVRAVAPNGVLGDPRGATAAAGEAIFVQMSEQAAEVVDRWAPTATGMLT